MLFIASLQSCLAQMPLGTFSFEVTKKPDHGIQLHCWCLNESLIIEHPKKSRKIWKCEMKVVASIKQVKFMTKQAAFCRAACSCYCFVFFAVVLVLSVLFEYRRSNQYFIIIFKRDAIIAITFVMVSFSWKAPLHEVWLTPYTQVHCPGLNHTLKVLQCWGRTSSISKW